MVSKNSLFSHRSVTLAGALFLGGTTHFAAAQDPAVRDLPASYTPSVQLHVSIALTIPAGIFAIGAEDVPPAGWTQIKSISNNGVYDAANHKVKWGPFFQGSFPIELSYDTTPPGDASGKQCFSGGVISLDGINQPITGDACFSPGGGPPDCSEPGGPQCDDGNECTQNICDPNSPGADEDGCVFPAEPFGTACTDDGNVCTDDGCNGQGACIHPNNSAPCNDGLFCNGSDTCAGGTCSVHPGNPCTGGPECADACNEAADHCFDPPGTACTDDGNDCTFDACNGGGICTHNTEPNGTLCGSGTDTDCDNPDSCQGGNCQPNHEPPGTPCDDGNSETCDDACTGGNCVGGPCDRFVIGGAFYTDCNNQLTSGEPDVQVVVTGPAGTFTATSGGPSGIWQLPDVPSGIYTVTPEKQQHKEFCHVVEVCMPDPDPCMPSAQIIVDEAHQAENLSIQFLAQDACMISDMNYDGMCTIVWDVDCFVQCVYGGDCIADSADGCTAPDGKDLVCPADCNCDGMATIVFDVECFVDDVYSGGGCGECPEPGPGPGARAASEGEGPGGFTIGGAVYNDEFNPLLSGIEGVTVRVLGADGGNVWSTETAGPMGIWRVDGLPEGVYTVVFGHQDQRPSPETYSVTIVVDAYNRATNQSILLLRLPNASQPPEIRVRPTSKRRSR